jgi:hypothetical protein
MSAGSPPHRSAPSLTLPRTCVPETIDGQPPLPVPDTCPATLDELLGDGD